MALRGRATLVILPVTALVCGGGAAVLEATAAASSSPAGHVPLSTPVLSVRRLPSVVAAPIAARRLRADLDAWSALAPSPSCLVVVGPAGQVAYERAADEPMQPASTLKLLTATAALLDLGPDARFHTAVRGAPPVDGVVSGDLHLVGGGDPLLATADYVRRFERQPQVFTDLDALAARIADAGIRHVTGAVVGDDTRYDSQRYVPGWPDRYRTQPVIGPLSALAVNDGFAAYPATWGGPGQLVPAPDPPAQAAALLTLLLGAHGVTVDGGARSGAAPAGAAELAAVDSVPLREVVAEMLQESDNATAELLLKELGLAAHDASTAGGRSRAAEVLERAGVDLDGVTLVDGSGLSPDDRATCRHLVEVLQRPGTGPVLRAALPVAGSTGTLFDRFTDTPVAGHLRAKTGTLNTVAGLAGVVTDQDGRLTFAYLVNAGPSGVVDQRAAEAAQGALAQILLDQPRRPDLAQLGPRPLRPAG
jgi:D-alanyl-D-alanine carboxypeptidase/D-alanyl-D-alanine-endopeptidase (penicillin-binding protein 4)